MKLKTFRALVAQQYKEALAAAEAAAKAEAAKEAAEFLLRNYQGFIPGTTVQVIKVDNELSISGTYWSEEKTLLFISNFFMKRLEASFGSFRVEPKRVSKEEIRKKIINSNKKVYEKVPAHHVRNNKNIRVYQERDEFVVSQKKQRASRDYETHVFSRQDKLKCLKKQARKERRELLNSLCFGEEKKKEFIVCFEGTEYNAYKILDNLQNGRYEKYSTLFDKSFKEFFMNFNSFNNFRQFIKKFKVERKYFSQYGKKTIFFYNEYLFDNDGNILYFDNKEELLEAAIIFYCYRVYNYGY